MALTKNHTLPDASAIRPVRRRCTQIHVRRSDLFEAFSPWWGSTMDFNRRNVGSKHDLIDDG